ncbi:MAG: hypothetical protein LBR60_02195 [Fibrobacter sp.]|jgi:wyosine [tRNA(Phe)-imidazoG37] synthetase (radical SAM superfamily)|nr:hypothetical protein [Fibrobacter sp.]
MSSSEKEELKKAWADHSRLWKKNRWVYPVISRRAGGLSIGINVNPDKRCSFNCLYCQVDRKTPGENIPFDLEQIKAELENLFNAYAQNGLIDFANLKELPKADRQIKDISVSGDGEPTLIPEFKILSRFLLDFQMQHAGTPLKLVLITNATRLHLPEVREGLACLTENAGEIWTKLDGGSDAWFKRISDSPYSLDKIQENIEMTVRNFPIRIQTMLCKVDNEIPSEQEIELYTERVKTIYEKNPENLLEVQLYGLIREPNTTRVAPLEKSFLENVARKIREKIPAEVGVY